MSKDALTDFCFHVPFSFTGTVDRENAIVRGVALITGGVTAEGHDLEVDDTTIQQIFNCAVKAVKVPVKLNHGAGVEMLNGYLSNFHLDGNKPRGDWHLLKSHEETPSMLERAEVMPECFGMSVAFKGAGEKIKGGKMAARCTKLLAVDCVTQPAANPEGLFSVDSARKGMAEEPTKKTGAEPTLADVMAELQSMRAELDAQKQFNEQLLASMEEPTLEDLAAMSDEQLTALGLTREEVEAALAEDQGAARAPAASAAPGGAGSELATLQKQVISLQSKFKSMEMAAEQEEVDNAFAVIATKAEALGAKNAELVELAAQKDTEIAALRLSLKTGARGVAPSQEGKTLFGAKDAPAGSFAALLTAKVEELKTGGKLTELQARSQAVQFCVKNHPNEYAEHRANGGTIEFGTK